MSIYGGFDTKISNFSVLLNFSIDICLKVISVLFNLAFFLATFKAFKLLSIANTSQSIFFF